MTGAPTLIHAEWQPRRSGTQDLIFLDPAFPWKPGEIAALQREIAARSGCPLRRVQYVVSLARRFESPCQPRIATTHWPLFIQIEYREYTGHTRCGNRKDWQICRAAAEVFAPLESSWKMRRLAALKKAADAERLPLRVRRATKARIGHNKYRGIYAEVAQQIGMRPGEVRAVAIGKKSNPEVLQVLLAYVAKIDSQPCRRGPL